MKSDKLDEQNRGEITQPTLVLCEGKRDASFVFHLTQQRGINGIQVGFPDPATSTAYGKDGFRDYLLNLRARSGFQLLRHVVILRDTDDDAQGAFADVVKQISAAGKYGLPGAPEQESAGVPGVTVRLIPDAATEGNLDLFLLSSISPDHPLWPCFSPYFECCQLDRLPVGTAAKIKLTSIVAASCQKNPGSSLVWVWEQPGNPIKLDSTEFDPIADFFKRFG